MSSTRRCMSASVIPAVLAPVLAVVLIGCGGGSDDPSARTPAPSASVDGAEVDATLDAAFDAVNALTPEERRRAAASDTTAPTVRITASTVTADRLAYAVSGTAADNVGVQQVVWHNKRLARLGYATLSSNGTSVTWSAPRVPVALGDNLIYIAAFDAAGNKTRIDTVLTLTAAPTTRPGPTNTGVPAGTTLRPSGPLQLTTAGQVVDGLDVTGCVAVRAPDVTIRRTRIRCDSYYPVEVYDGASLVIEDSEIDGSPSNGAATSGIAFSNFVARRVNIHGTADGVKADANAVLEDSWIHDLYLGPEDHADGVQSTGGSGVTIRRNFIDIRDLGRGHGGDPNSVFQIGTEWGPNSNWTIEGNWIYGGGWSINAYSGSGTGNRITENRFGRGAGFPGYGPISVTGNWRVTGNVWDDDGSPVAP